jgi:hypothetical protein
MWTLLFSYLSIRSLECALDTAVNATTYMRGADRLHMTFNELYEAAGTYRRSAFLTIGE